MRTELRVSLCAAMAALAAAACAQSPTVYGAQAMLSSGGAVLAPAARPAPGEIVREIVDPHTGERWLLMRDETFPGGPGRLALVASERNWAAGGLEQAARQNHEAQPLPVIRAGDPLIVEEHTAVVDARLEARALNSAALGSALHVRLAIGGRVVRVVALGPGRAALQPETGVRP